MTQRAPRGPNTPKGGADSEPEPGSRNRRAGRVLESLDVMSKVEVLVK